MYTVSEWNWAMMRSDVTSADQPWHCDAHAVRKGGAAVTPLEEPASHARSSTRQRRRRLQRLVTSLITLAQRSKQKVVTSSVLRAMASWRRSRGVQSLTIHPLNPVAFSSINSSRCTARGREKSDFKSHCEPIAVYCRKFNNSISHSLEEMYVEYASW